MIKYIKVNGKQIVEVRPLLPADYFVDGEYIVNPEVEARFDKEFLRVDIPDELDDIELLSGYYYESGKLVQTSEIKDRQKLSDEMKDIHIWLEENDWKVNKITVGEWETTDPRWLEYKEKRAVKRARLDKIKEALGI